MALSQIGRCQLPRGKVPMCGGAVSPRYINVRRTGPYRANPGAFSKSGLYSVDMDVRDYELDQFNVVNNAVYASYLQHARHEAFAALGFDIDDFARNGTPLALAELKLNFKAPLRSRDRFRVTVWVSKVTAARLVMGQSIPLLPRRFSARTLENGNPSSGLEDNTSSEAGRSVKGSGSGSSGDDGGTARGGMPSSLDATASKEVECDAVLVVSAEAVVVWLDSQYRPLRVPGDIRAVMVDLNNRHLTSNSQHD